MNKKIRFSEWAFVLGTIFSAAGVALQVQANMGISMVVAPAYILSLKIPGLSFGMAEWVIQGLLFALSCVVLRKLAFKNLWSFAAVICYGWVLDLMTILFNPFNATTLSSQLVLYGIGTLSLSFGIALYFRTYLPCLVYEMFIKTLANQKSWNIDKVKIVFDWCCLLIAAVMSFLLFGSIKGVGVGTLILTLINGPLITFWGKLLDKMFDFTPQVKILKKIF